MFETEERKIRKRSKGKNQKEGRTKRSKSSKILVIYDIALQINNFTILQNQIIFYQRSKDQ